MNVFFIDAPGGKQGKKITRDEDYKQYWQHPEFYGEVYRDYIYK